ncbi:MAG: molecular chaperone TorD family protein [Deferribacteraceae bacterium]|nr:molecular chaperone TorD family protein [Deferribacteraceae bacterium]
MLSGILQDRELLYKFMSRCFLKEVDQEYLDTLKSINYSNFNEANPVDEGFRLLSKYVANTGDQTLLNLARDYARTFLGAGLAQNEGAYPYESVYTSPDHLLMQNARDEALKIYYSEELGRSNGFTEPEDHIAFELEFMAHLCDRAAKAVQSKDFETLRANMVKQKAFLENNLNKWVPGFCDDVIRIAREDFYRALAMITKGFLEEESVVIEYIMKDL